MSKRMHARVVNVDIGGGTTNIAVFDRGNCIGTACINVGGRLFEVGPQTHRISYLAPAAQKVVDRLEAEGKAYDRNSAAGEFAMLQEALKAMVGCVDRVILGEELTPLDRELVMTNSLPKVPIDVVVFSGGVARYIYDPSHAQWWVHQDVGPLLANAYRQGRIYSGYQVMEGTETINATVLGAGAHTVNVSGSTITIAEECLPLRNVPAVYPEITRDLDGNEVYSWRRMAANYTESLYKTVALVVPPLPSTSFKTITRLAENIASEAGFIAGSPKVIVAQQDIAKVLGQTLLRLMGNTVPIVCLDSISLKMGDYLDIAKPLPVQEAVPVIVKTLVFVQN
jgi:ethanolamine utilization protein EutA